ncbi:E3 ubiquitin-protein ligase Zswim2 [Patella vulgata]|uniref:E3 ubiquitin-protein ligase Zswim2 n=1 Tax=Patella vulgata TaxID=6465 RepID=UPI00217F8ABF|nr:E3 ubiquitin-protein ligase Zswim2 [Patella vulgata]
MARSVAWRRTLNDIVCWRQAEASNATIYILRETGPTAFLLKEEGEQKNVKAFLGDPHSCTCAQFRKDKDLCKHICWLLLKKFRVPKENPLTWQLGLVEREINEILRGTVQQQQRRQQEKKVHRTVLQAADGRSVVGQRDISEDDVCPICQDELLAKHLPVTYCKFGCGNSIHIKCMKVWADHQQGKGETNVKCPMCREDFGPFNLLKQEMRNAGGGQTNTVVRMDRHLGTNCQSCHVAPIEGKCYRCVVCADFQLCQSCFNSPIHTHHNFEYRHKRNQRWRGVNRMTGGLLPEAVVNNMMNRDITADDYDYLLQLDSNQEFEGSDLTEETVNSLPQEKVREGGQLLAPGVQCRICLRGYEIGQVVRRLPCRHKFHKDCVDNWLLHTRPVCPVDGQSVITPLQDISSPNSLNRERRSSTSSEAIRIVAANNQQQPVNLEIPGFGLTIAPAARTEGSNGILLRRPPRQNHSHHRAPSSLELAGTRFLNSEPRFNEVHTETTPSSLLPGNRLLHRAEQQRQMINQQLSMIDRHLETRPTINAPHNIELNNILRTGSSSAPPLVSRKPPAGQPISNQSNTDSPTVRRGRTTQRKPTNDVKHPYLKRRSGSRDRSASRERILSQAIQQAQDLNVQNLFLGNNPRTNPIQGEVIPTVSSRRQGQIKSSSIAAASKSTHQPSQGVDIQLEGLGLENMTLRDIIN